MQSEIDNVTQFHRKNGFAVGADLKDYDDDGYDHLLNQSSVVVKSLAAYLESLMKEMGRAEMRIVRAHLMLEELAEVLGALASRDEVELLDGLSDLAYVVVGCAVAFDLPLHEGFLEAHKSNMTKTRSDNRLRDKGPDYKAPNFTKVLYQERGR